MASSDSRITRAQARAVDRFCIDDLGIPGLLLMEHAALSLRNTLLGWMGQLNRRGPVLIVCGGGNNGGDGFALARLLHLENTRVDLLQTRPVAELRGDAATNGLICEKLGLPIRPATAEAIKSSRPAAIVDALLGTGFSRDGGPLRAEIVNLIQAINEHSAPVLSVDVPSGLDADTGQPADQGCIRADLTCTFVAEKVGFPRAGEFTGRVVVGDIGAPVAATRRSR